MVHQPSAGQGNKWCYDGSKVEQYTAIGKVYGAGVGILHRDRHIMVRVTSPKCTYRA